MSLRIAAGIALLIATSLFSGESQTSPAPELFQERTGAQQIGRDLATAYLFHAKSLKLYLPAHGVVGYVTDDPSLANHYKLLLIRHALAPLVVEKNVLHQFVVGNFMDGRARDKIARQDELRVIKDFGYGLVLFRGSAGR
jgi:hypothetical protein